MNDSAALSPQEFGAWLGDQLASRGYDPKRRGRAAAFAAKSGINPATLSQILGGRRTKAPDVRTLSQLSEALGVPLALLLIRAGHATPEQLADIHRPEGGHLTPERAAEELGITTPERVQAFAHMVKAFREAEQLPPAAADDPPRTAHQ
ncbi:helix-turn-helix domain-containing protein [Streptomyces sp. URMC 129]|uniref:helix-turn-helix domain-containing protein n=1 Tax=Streptomyces sp. URMC 129 TaxID=3423407 RepID=UPI003F1D6950